MKQRVITLATLALIATLLVVAPVFAYIYRAPYTVTSENTTNFEMIGVHTDNAVNNQWMADNGFFNSTANDTRIETLGGLEKPHMVTENATLTAIPVPANSQTNLYFTTGRSEQDFNIIPGYGGSVNVTDADNIELGDNFTIEQSGWVDTSSSVVGEDFTSKAGAFGINISGVEEITAGIPSATHGIIPVDGNALDYERGNSDWTSIPDANDLSFTDGAGNDEPFTFIAWVWFEDASASTILSKRQVAGDNYEYYFFTDATDKLELRLENAASTTAIGRETNALTAYEGSWVHLGGTYDGSEVSGGCNVYVNGVDADVANTIVGAYAGMSPGVGLFRLGSMEGTNFLDGAEAVVKVYDVELTPAEVLADYNGTHKATDLVAYYKIDEGAGLPQDSSGNGHHATANLADWRRSPTVIATSIASGEHTVLVTANATHMWIDIDAVTEDTILLAGASVPDNSANWTFMQNNVMPYADNITISVSGTLELWFQPNDIISGTTLPDRQGGDNPGTFIWGANPAGVSVTMGGLVSSAQPLPGVTVDDPTPDIMPEVEVTDWYIEPDVGGTLLTNPMRPFVTMLSDNSTLTELQAWRILGTALLLLVTVSTAKVVRGHHAITGIAAGATTLGLVVWTIYPMWALVFIIFAVIAGLISERTPSL